MRRLLALVLLALALVPACGSGNKVGNSALLNFKDQAQRRLGEETTTTAAAAAVQSPGQEAALGATTTAAPRPTPQATAPPATTRVTAPPTTRAVAVLQVTINPDQSTLGAFNPQVARVYQGTRLTWVNHDTVARSVVADQGAFSSPPIPPGGSYTWVAQPAGQYNYHDGTRPYAVGSVQVVPV